MFFPFLSLSFCLSCIVGSANLCRRSQSCIYDLHFRTCQNCTLRGGRQVGAYPPLMTTADTSVRKAGVASCVLSGIPLFPRARPLTQPRSPSRLSPTKAPRIARPLRSLQMASPNRPTRNARARFSSVKTSRFESSSD
jgi:hypothetical protein